MGKIIIDILLALIILITAAFWLYAEKKDGGALKKKQKNVIKRILISSIIVFALQFVSADVFDMLNIRAFAYAGRILRLAAYLVSYVIIGGDILKKAFRGIKNKRVFDENFLMVIASLGALALAVYENGDYLEAVAVMIFYQIGELFQSYAVGKSRRNISALMDLRPDYANIETDGNIERVDPETVAPGTVISVLPGERVPIDGIITDGVSSVNTSALTGESIPRDVAVGDEVLSGCINLTGLIKIRTEKSFGDSTVSKMLHLVEDASTRKSKSEAFITKFARYYTPAVCFAALALAFLPPLCKMLILGGSAGFGVWLYRALTFLVISCPCALVISIPLGFFAGIGGAGKAGILIKGSSFLEALAQTKIIVMDKTGTLTKGVFEVSEIHFNEAEKEKLLEYAALAESSSPHPIAKSIVSAYGGEIDRSRITEIEEIAGYGVTARVDGKLVAVGNGRFFKKLNIKCESLDVVGTVAYLAVEGEYKGYTVISDTVKSNSAKALKLLKKAGVKKTVMLTGDGKAVAEKVGKELGIDEIHSELMPEDKLRIVGELLKTKRKNERLAFVGDGINDAPALMTADIGIAMGAMGSDAAIEAADVVLMDDDPMKIVTGIRISRKCLSIVYQNIVFALSVKFISLILGAFGIVNMWIAVFADVGVMVLAVLNAVRALSVRLEK